MSQQSAYFNGYDAVELPVPSGAVIRCRPLSVPESARFHRMFNDIADANPDAIWTLMEEFPKAVDAEEAFGREVHPAEFLQVVADFFGLEFAQKRVTGKMEPSPTKTPAQPDASASTN